MTPLQNTEAKILDSHFLNGHLQNASENTVTAQTNPTAYKKDWELNRQLQTSLHIRDVLNLFFTGLQEEFQFAQMSFTQANQDTPISIGEKSARHNCNYQIEIAGETLGRMSFTRSIRFAEQELNRLEELLCLLVYPLRNAVLYEQALKKAMHDPLTGALNRSALDTMLDKEIDLATRHGNDLALLMLDVDHFKQINDTYGHGTGDKVLCSLVNSLKKQIRTSDVLFRYGGEEFTLLLNNTTIDGAHLLAQRIRSAVEQQTHVTDTDNIQFTISIGVAQLNHAETAQQLLEKADIALYAAKKMGRNCVVKA